MKRRVNRIIGFSAHVFAIVDVFVLSLLLFSFATVAFGGEVLFERRNFFSSPVPIVASVKKEKKKKT